MGIINAEVIKNQNEPSASFIRRFTKRVQGSGVLNYVKRQKFYKRPESKLKKKDRALKRITKQKEIERLKKLGKIK